MSIRLGGKDYKLDEKMCCKLWEDCNTCPLPRCTGEKGQGRLRQRTYRRYLEIAYDHHHNPRPMRKIAKAHGCCKLTVYRALKWYDRQIGRTSGG